MSLLMDALRKAEEAKKAAENSLLAAASELEMHDFSRPDSKRSVTADPVSISDPQRLVTEIDQRSAVSKSEEAIKVKAETLPEVNTTEVKPVQAKTNPAAAIKTLTEKTTTADRAVETTAGTTAEITTETRVVYPSISFLKTARPAAISEHTQELSALRKADTEKEKIFAIHGANALFAAKRQQDKLKLRHRLQATLALFSIVIAGASGLWFYNTLNSGAMTVNPQDIFAYSRPVYGADSSPLELPKSEVITILHEEQADDQTVAGSAESNSLAEQFLIGKEIQKKSVEKEVNALTMQQIETADSAPIESVEAVTAVEQAVTAEQIQPVALNRISFSRQKRPDNALETLLVRAYSSYQQGDFELAASLYGQVLVKSPTDRNALLGLATIASQNNAPTQAMTYYSRLLARDPSDAVARAGLLNSRPLGSIGEQEIAFKKLLREHADVPPVAYAMGNFYASQQNWSAAQGYYFAALRQAKSMVSEIGLINPDYAFNLGVSLEHLNQRLPAVAYYQEALELADKHPASFDLVQLEKRVTDLIQVGAQ